MTPTCKTCGTKFPGKTECKVCGADPNARPTIGQRIALKLKIKPATPLKRDRSAHKAYVRSINAPSQRRRMKHGRQVRVR